MWNFGIQRMRSAIPAPFLYMFIHLMMSCDIKDVEAEKLYQYGIVNSKASFGVFVDLNPHIRGLICTPAMLEEPYLKWGIR